MDTVSYTIERSITREDIIDILSASLTGSYWAEVDWNSNVYKQAKEELKKTMDQNEICLEDVLAQILLMGKQFYICDTEDEDADWTELTLNKLIDGCKLYEEKTGNSVKSIIGLSQLDMSEADMILQYALFNDIIYG